MTFYLSFKLKTRNLLLVYKVLAKKKVIQAYNQKIDFIEKTCPSYYSRLLTIGEDGFKYLFKHCEFCLSRWIGRMNGAKLTSEHLLCLIEHPILCTSCLQSLVNATPRYLNFSTCFNKTPPNCGKHWTGFFKRCSTSVSEMLVFIPAMSHAAAIPFNACWTPDSKKLAKLNHL